MWSMDKMTSVAGPVPAISFSKPKGEAAFLAPDSVQWRVFKNPVALAIGGVAAVLLEFADPRIRSGVWDHSVYKVDPIGRSRRTGMVAMVGVYGPRSTARRVIGGINRMHAKVSGETPAGEKYRALDAELLNWVFATAQYGFLSAYDRFVTRLSEEAKLRFWSEGEAIATLYGVTQVPGSEADFLNMMQAQSTKNSSPSFNRVKRHLQFQGSSTARWRVPPYPSCPRGCAPGLSWVRNSIYPCVIASWSRRWLKSPSA
jgi:uncharacterized protein (DUF2236 family)